MTPLWSLLRARCARNHPQIQIRDQRKQIPEGNLRRSITIVHRKSSVFRWNHLIFYCHWSFLSRETVLFRVEVILRKGVCTQRTVPVVLPRVRGPVPSQRVCPHYIRACPLGFPRYFMELSIVGVVTSISDAPRGEALDFLVGQMI